MSKQLLDTPSKHSSSLVALADSAWNNIRDRAFGAAWSPLTRLAEKAALTLMQRIDVGHLRVLTYSNIYEFPLPGSEVSNARDDLRAELRVVNDVFWVRLCAMGDLGFSEAYMYGDVECDDLVALFEIFLLNRKNLSNMDSMTSYLFTLPQKLTSYRFLNNIGNSQSNISAHYDISNEMFAGFLSEDMTYSCAIFDTLDGDLRGLHGNQHAWSGGQRLLRLRSPSSRSLDSAIHWYPPPPPTQTPKDELHDAQMRKLRHIVAKARLSSNQRVLEIGSGWGSMAILIAQSFAGTTVDTLTLSVRQQSMAQSRIKAAGLEERITVHLMDYRAMPDVWKGRFDRVISIEMIEAVGAEFLEEYWGVVDWALKPDVGVGVVQVITIPEPRYDRYRQEIDFIRKWVFPGGFLPTVTHLLQAMEKGSSGRLIVDSISNIGPHYARTLREWRRRFLDRFDSVIIPALRAEYPSVMSGPRGMHEIEVFKRKWLYYYCYCEVGFTTRTLGDHIITFTREGCVQYGCDVYE
ncbi:cyclopropane-fatty-acyl-phospholipid synthase [Leucogyrophana mollusca]|uniref:Cyclopropane-fatty-acyl-phospholipid synthase n=1 Tax=Leucogyrophana mollusca TaxID=85980 RepID=A0ACB8B402_9AGAM|nr:cyclopropane-fatty-acyl-phospholipid synthase [Leucogyrophana mollusca]